VSRNTLRGIADQFQHWLKGWTETSLKHANLRAS
jgi:hypothetical protein